MTMKIHPASWSPRSILRGLDNRRLRCAVTRRHSSAGANPGTSAKREPDRNGRSRNRRQGPTPPGPPHSDDSWNSLLVPRFGMRLRRALDELHVAGDAGSRRAYGGPDGRPRRTPAPAGPAGGDAPSAPGRRNNPHPIASPAQARQLPPPGGRTAKSWDQAEPETADLSVALARAQGRLRAPPRGRATLLVLRWSLCGVLLYDEKQIAPGRRAGDLRKMPAIHDCDQPPETPRSDESCEEDLTGRQGRSAWRTRNALIHGRPLRLDRWRATATRNGRQPASPEPPEPEASRGSQPGGASTGRGARDPEGERRRRLPGRAHLPARLQRHGAPG